MLRKIDFLLNPRDDAAAMEPALELVLRNPRSKEQISIFFEIFDSPLALRWKSMLRAALERPHVLEKNSSFIGFIHGYRNKAYLCRRLDLAAERICRFQGPSPWNQGYSIQRIPHPETLTFELLNDYHHHFEILMGGTFDISDYYRNAPAEIREEIRMVNYLVHELEAVLRSEKSYEQSKKIYPYSVVEFLEPSIVREELQLEDYNLFSLRHVFGDLQIAYCQTGKTPYEAWRDKDENIHDKNINGIQYYSANFLVRWGPSSDPENQKRQIEEPFRKWLEEKGIDLSQKTFYTDNNGKRHGLGFLTVGRFSPKGYEGKSVDEIQKLISDHPDIFKIILHSQPKTEKVYDYSVDDPSFRTQLHSTLTPDV